VKFVKCALLVLGLAAAPAFAKDACTGFNLLGLVGDMETTVAAASVPPRIRVVGRYLSFDVVASSFAVENYTIHKSVNDKAITAGVHNPVYAAKTPNHRGLALNSPVKLTLQAERLELVRYGPGLTMTLRARDCAQGTMFRMEIKRDDGTPTIVTHTLATAAGNLQPFYFDNVAFRAREGDTVAGSVVTPRINIANDFSSLFVVQDIPQAATRINEPACATPIDTRARTIVNVEHCGNRSIWSVASGGAMEMAAGGDAVEVRDVPIGFPFPVPATDRLRLGF
jgi:hypothetical protein